MDEADLIALACISSECSKMIDNSSETNPTNKREMQNGNKVQTGTITILRGPYPSDQPPESTRREGASEIIDYSINPKRRHDLRGQSGAAGSGVTNQPTTSKTTVLPTASSSKRKRSRFLAMDPVDQALMNAEYERLDALRAKEFDKRNFWLENDEDVAFFNSVLPHLLDDGVLENDNSPPQSPSASRRELCGFYCGNCGQKFYINR